MTPKVKVYESTVAEDFRSFLEMRLVARGGELLGASEKLASGLGFREP